MKTVLTEEHYKRLTRLLSKNRILNESNKERADFISQSVAEILSDNSLTNKSLRFEALHSLTKEVMESLNPSFRNLSDSVTTLKTYEDAFNSTQTKDEFWVIVNSNKINFINSKGSKKNNANDEKITENFSTDISPLSDILNLMKTSQIDDQSVLSFCEDTDYSKTTADGHEAFAALLFAKYLNQNYLITATAEKGVDCIQKGGPYTIEVKGSSSADPNTNFSGTLPKYSLTHFYVFLTTDRSYIIRSDILRAYYVLGNSSPDEEAEIFFKNAISKDNIKNKVETISKLKNFVLKTNPSDSSLDNLKGKDFEHIYRYIANLENNHELKILYKKILSEIESQSQSLSVSLLQSLLGLEGNDRVMPPQISIGGLYVYLRPVLKGGESSFSSSDSSSSIADQTLSSSKLIKKFEEDQYSILNNILVKYRFSSINTELKKKVLAHALTIIKGNIEKELKDIKNNIFDAHLEEIGYNGKIARQSKEKYDEAAATIQEYDKNFQLVLKLYQSATGSKTEEFPSSIYRNLKTFLKLPNSKNSHKTGTLSPEHKIIKQFQDNSPPAVKLKLQAAFDKFIEDQERIEREMDEFINEFIDNLEERIRSYSNLSIGTLYEGNKKLMISEEHKKRLLKYIKNHKM